MFDYIWAGIMLTSVITGGITGRMPQVSQAMISGASAGLEVFLILLAVMCLWNGVMNIASRSGLTDRIGRIIWPLLGLLFPKIERDSDAARYISLNVASNILGLGNAATPAGLKAMQQLDSRNSGGITASDEMVTFVVLNSVSIQLIPTGVAALRTKAGAPNCMDIIPAVWIASVASAAVGISIALILNKRGKKLC